MTAKEKAKELIEKYSKVEIQIGGEYDGYMSMQLHDAKECALILVDEIIKDTYGGAQLRRWEAVKSELHSL